MASIGRDPGVGGGYEWTFKNEMGQSKTLCMTPVIVKIDRGEGQVPRQFKGMTIGLYPTTAADYLFPDDDEDIDEDYRSTDSIGQMCSKLSYTEMRMLRDMLTEVLRDRRIDKTRKAIARQRAEKKRKRGEPTISDQQACSSSSGASSSSGLIPEEPKQQ